MASEVTSTRQAAVYEAALRLVGQGVNPATMTIQQLADAAGIGKGTVYEYFSSKEEILHGLAVYCFERENERIRALFADCETLARLEECTVDYLCDIAANRMGDYKMIAKTMDMPCCGNDLESCLTELRVTICNLLDHLQTAGEMDPKLDKQYCCTAMFSVVVGGLMGMYYNVEHHIPVDALAANLRTVLHRTLKKE